MSLTSEGRSHVDSTLPAIAWAEPVARRETVRYISCSRYRGRSTAVHDDKWVSVDSFADRFSAEALVGLLAGEGVPAYISADEPIPGLARNFAVLVPPDLLQRAQWIVKQASVSDSELTSLAVGVHGPAGEEST